MSCDCNMGLSAKAIKYSGEKNHPHDPGDLKRCIDYCMSSGIDTKELRRRMSGRSAGWDALLPHWNELIGMLTDETETRADGCAPATYERMRDLLRGAK